MAEIREALASDRERVIQIWDACDLLRPQNDPIKDFDLALATITSTVLVIQDNAEIAGAVMVGFDGHRGWFYYLGVHPTHQELGFGRELVRAAENWLANRGAPKSMLMVRDTNAAVRTFYEKLGYVLENTSVMGKRFEEPSV